MKLIGLRKAQGYTQQSFSEAAGVSKSHYAQIETGVKNPSLKLSLQIKAALGYTNDDLFFDTPYPKKLTESDLSA